MDFEIVEEQIDAQEDQLCKQVCKKADYIDGLIDKFLDESPEKALAFLTAIEVAANSFLMDEFLSAVMPNVEVVHEA